LHRHQEADFSGFLLKNIFHDERFFTHHPPVPKSVTTSDEGAANHNRFCQRHAEPGLHLFVYGKRGNLSPSQRFPARQSLEASEVVVRNHQLRPQQVLFAQQNPWAIDSGVFHNDVISVANESVFLVHEKAFVEQQALLGQLTQKAPFPLHVIEIPDHQISLTDAVRSYLFNSQLITLPHTTSSKNMVLIAPTECLEPNIKGVLDTLIADPHHPISNVHFLDLRQSMQNGGGPACLRLRVPLNETELTAIPSSILVNDLLLNRLETWIQRHYRTELHPEDLQDPALITECFEALDELTQILKLGYIYPFQE
jgi:succinylarginine dihydrolase